jgi:broad-specificity NMP kinase
MIVELAGPAGVGKSTLSRALKSSWTAASGSIWGLPDPLLVAHGVRAVPSFVPLWRTAGTLLWNETTHMVRLRTLEDLLLQKQQQQPVIFDEGPVFTLAWLRGFGHPVMKSLAADPWWQTTLRSWSRLIDAVVVLDAPDSLLAQRIRTRPNDHEVKHASNSEIAVWMGRFREALEWVLAELAKEQGPIVIRLETTSLPPHLIAQQVQEGLNRGVYAG